MIQPAAASCDLGSILLLLPWGRDCAPYYGAGACPPSACAPCSSLLPPASTSARYSDILDTLRPAPSTQTTVTWHCPNSLSCQVAKVVATTCRYRQFSPMPPHPVSEYTTARLGDIGQWQKCRTRLSRRSMSIVWTIDCDQETYRATPPSHRKSKKIITGRWLIWVCASQEPSVQVTKNCCGWIVGHYGLWMGYKPDIASCPCARMDWVTCVYRSQIEFWLESSAINLVETGNYWNYDGWTYPIEQRFWTACMVSLIKNGSITVSPRFPEFPSQN